MGYRGRVTLLVVACIVAAEFVIYDIIHRLPAIRWDIIVAIIVGIIAWFLGKQYDKERFYSKDLEMKQSELQQVFDGVDVGIWSRNFRTNRRFISSGILKIYGYSKEEFMARPSLWHDVVHPEDAAIMNTKNQVREYRIIRPNHEIRWIQDRVTLFKDSAGHVIKMYGVSIDITNRKKADEEMSRAALHDTLTELPNRYYMKTYMKQAIESCRKHGHTLAVMVIDLDEFKQVNDTFGHRYGDSLLQKAANKLTESVRNGDMVFRFGGDEFILVLAQTSQQETEQVAKRVINQFSERIHVLDEEVNLTLSVGISLCPSDGDDAETLIHKADRAMYGAKANGKNCYQFWDENKG